MANYMDELQKWFDDKIHSVGYVYYNDLLREIGFPVSETQNSWIYILNPISGEISLIKGPECGHIINPTVEDFRIERIKL